MNIILNTEKAYKLTELAQAVQTADDDLLYIVQNINGQETSIAIRRDVFLAGIVPQGKELISGGASYSGSGLIFDVSDLVFRIDGVIYTSVATSVTLNAGDPTDPRFDLIVVNSASVVSVIEGTPSVNPVYPALGVDQVLVAPVLIGAGAVTPTVITEVIYKEDVEWTTSTLAIQNPQTGSINFQSTNNPYQGTFCVQYATNKNSAALFTDVALNLGDYSIFSCWIFLPTNQAANTNISVIAINQGNQVGSVNLNQQGLSRTTTGSWQQVVFPVALFGTAIVTAFAIRFSGNSVYTFRIDNIELQSGQLIPPSNTINIRKDGTLIGATGEVNFVQGTDVTISAVQNQDGSISVTINSTGGGGGGGQVNSVVGTASQIDVDSSDPANPVLSLASAVTTSLGKADSAVQSIGAGTGISVNNTDPQNPIVSSTVSPGGQVNSVVGTVNQISVNNTDPVNPVLSLPSAVTNALASASTAVQPGANVSVFTNDAGYVNAAGAAAAAPVQSVTGTAVTGTSANPIVNNPLEQVVLGTAGENLTVTGATNISLSTNADTYLRLTGNATITFTGTPASGISIVRSFTIQSTVAETLGIANSTDEFGTYAADGTENEVTVKASNWPTEGLKIKVFFEQPN